MKKTTLAVLALLGGATLGTPAMAQEMSATTEKEIYDFSGYGTEVILDLFYNALQQGRNYPTAAEFEAKGIQASDIAFIRSHVRKAQLLDTEDRVVENTYKNRKLWMNIPMDAGKNGGVGYPSTKFASDVFSLWNYTDLFGSWNHGFFHAPGAWVDAAHQNGSDIMSGITFFESWTPGSGDQAYSAMIAKKNSDGSYKYVKPLINCLLYFGADGINYNWEDNSYGDEDVVAFHKALYKEAEAQNFKNFRIGIYTANSGLNAGNVNALYGNKETGKTADVMLNYAASDFSYQMDRSVETAEAAMGTAEGVYAGVWIVSMDRGWNRLDKNESSKRCGLCLWGEHDQSRFWSYNVGSDAYDAQGNYQRLLERAFSGGNRNPLERPAVSNTGNNWEPDGEKAPLSTFCGLAQFIPERSAIQGNLPFGTHFTLGNGDRYYYKGKKTAGSWYNMAAQDIVPTYRWLVTKAGTQEVSQDIVPNYIHTDAYTGGSCLELSGKAVAGGTDLVLYKTKLTMTGSKAVAKVAIKSGKEGKTPSNLYVIFKKAGAANFEEVAVAGTEGKAWEEKLVEIPSLAKGDVIERIGLRVKGNEDNYKLLVGKLEINDNSVVTPAAVKDLVVEVKQETKVSMAMKLNWGVDAVGKARADWGMLYNDEANIDHFQVLYKVGEKGRVAEVGRTSQWATVLGDIFFENATDVPYVGVRSVSTDLKTYSPIVWVKVDRAAQEALPEREEADTYGVSAMDPNCQGADIARKERYVTSVVTTGADQNLNYSANAPVADGSQYADARNQVLKVKQGQEVNLTIKCADFGDGLKWCFAGGWIDLDGSGTFNHPLGVTTNVEGEETDPLGERVFRVGKVRAASPEFQSTGITATFKVPEDATPGKSRLRIVFSDAWFAGAFLPVGLHAKGFTIDFGAEITGTNPGRSAADTRDQGVADEPEQMEGGTTGIETVENEVSEVVLEGDHLNLKNVEKAWIYTVEGKFVQFVQKGGMVNVANYVPGAYIVKMQNNNVIRSAKVLVK